MTFSQKIKEELLKVKFHCNNCSFVFIYTVLHFTAVKNHEWIYSSDKKEIIDLLTEKIAEDIGVIVTEVEPDIYAKRKNQIFYIIIDDKDDLELFKKRYTIPFEVFFSQEVLKNDCCKSAFLRGLFLSCGTVVNPEKKYHFEFKISNKKSAELIHKFLNESGFPMKRTERKGNEILYLKESEPIEELLTYSGAVRCVLELMNIKIEKELRNKVNRVINCETANIQKTVAASMKQVEEIKLIIQSGKMDELSEDLKQTAKARLENPEMSLTELCELMPIKISRSGLNHRLKKLSAIAHELS